MWKKGKGLLEFIFGKRHKRFPKSGSDIENKKEPIREPLRKSNTSEDKISKKISTTESSAPEAQTAKEKRDLIIGFDLGTACTKIVIQDPSLRLAHAIPLSDDNDSLRRYLIPTEIRISDDAEFSLEKGDQKTFIRYLKLLLMEYPKKKYILNTPSHKFEASGLEITAAFVALILRKARDWFMKERAKVYEGLDIIWHLNVGIPTVNYDNFEIKRDFEDMARGAWWLSIQNSPITWELTKEMKQLVESPGFYPGIHQDRINVVPEIAAQVVGYARSPLREEGLHMLVDIGASTVDTATFNLIKDENLEDKYIFFAAQVERLGALELHYHRVEYIEKWIKECKDCFDPLNPIPNIHDDYILQSNKLKDVDEEFLQAVCKTVRQVVAFTKKEKDPNSEKWKEGLPLFICGGASQLEFYNNRMIQKVEGELNKIWNWKGFKPKIIPKPDNLIAEGLKLKNYHRLTVAYGLSFLYDDIGRIVPPSVVENIRLTRNPREYEFISKDQV